MVESAIPLLTSFASLYSADPNNDLEQALLHSVYCKIQSALALQHSPATTALRGECSFSYFREALSAEIASFFVRSYTPHSRSINSRSFDGEHG